MLAAQIHVEVFCGKTTGASFALGLAQYIVFGSEVAQFAGCGIEIPLHSVGFQFDGAERIDIKSLRVAFQIDPRDAITVVEINVGVFRHGAALTLGYLHRSGQCHTSALLVIPERGRRQVDRRLGGISVPCFKSATTLCFSSTQPSRVA